MPDVILERGLKGRPLASALPLPGAFTTNLTTSPRNYVQTAMFGLLAEYQAIKKRFLPEFVAIHAEATLQEVGAGGGDDGACTLLCTLRQPHCVVPYHTFLYV